MTLMQRRRALMGEEKPAVLAYSLADPILWTMGTVATGVMVRGESDPAFPNTWTYYGTKSIATKNKRLFSAENVNFCLVDSGFIIIIAFDAAQKYLGYTDLIGSGQHRLKGMTLHTQPNDPADPKNILYDNAVKFLQFCGRKSAVISSDQGEPITTAFAEEMNCRLYY